MEDESNKIGGHSNPPHTRNPASLIRYGYADKLLNSAYKINIHDSLNFIPGFFGMDKRSHEYYFSPTRMLINGASGCGKTSAICDLIMSFKDRLFQKFYLFASNLEQPIYQLLEHDIHENFYLPLKEHLSDLDFDDVFKKCSTFEEMPKYEDFDSDLRNFVLIDDFLLDKNMTAYSQNLFIKGRHKNVSVCYISQHFTSINKAIKNNANYICLYKPNQQSSIADFHTKYASDLTLKEFKKLFNKCTEEPFDFMTIDMQAPIKYKYRKRFDSYEL